MDLPELDAELGSVSAHEFKKKLILGIKEIYRDARHLCADAVMASTSIPEECKEAASRQCINARNIEIETLR